MKKYCLQSLAIIEITGKDALDFLQRTTSQSFKAFENGEVKRGAFLTATGTVVSVFCAIERDHTILLIVDKNSLDKTLKQIEKLHFSEDLEYKTSTQYSVIEITPVDLGTPFFLGQSFGFQVIEQRDFEKAIHDLESRGFNSISIEELNVLKTEHFTPRDQVELSESNIILEAGLTDFVHRNKGCYPGQEVIERIYTYGNIPRKLVQLKLSRPMAPNSELFLDDQKIGRITSASPETLVGNGYVLRTKAMIDQKLRGRDGSELTIVRVTPDLNKDAAVKT